MPSPRPLLYPANPASWTAMRRRLRSRSTLQMATGTIQHRHSYHTTLRKLHLRGTRPHYPSIGSKSAIYYWNLPVMISWSQIRFEDC